MVQKTALITGATSGIGLVGAKALAAAGYKLYLPVRNRAKAEQVKTDILAETPHAEIQLLDCDFSSLASVRDCALRLKDECSQLDRLINNAGLVELSLKFSQDGVENTFAVNHLAHFLLTLHVLPLLKAAQGARIVHTASEANYQGDAAFLDDINHENRRYRFFKVYGDSKLANILFSNKLARDLASDGILSNSFHPGRVATAIWPDEKWYEKLIIGPLKRWYLISPEQGAKPMIKLALDENVDFSGRFYFEMNERKPHVQALSQEHQDRLWERSMALCEAYL